jgi:hypothetical protein
LHTGESLSTLPAVGLLRFVLCAAFGAIHKAPCTYHHTTIN